MLLFMFFLNWNIIALQAVLVSAGQQCESATCVHILHLSRAPPRLPIPPASVIPEHHASVPALHSSFLLAVLHMVLSMYANTTLPIHSPFFFTTVSASLLSLSLPLFLPCKQGHQYRFSRFHKHTLVYDIFFSKSSLAYHFDISP